MARQTVTALNATLNSISTALVATAGSSSGLTISASEFGTLNMLFVNGSTNTITLTLEAGTSGTEWIGKGVGNSTATTLGSLESRILSGVESCRFKSTDNVLFMAMASTASTGCAAVSIYAWQNPIG